RCGGSAAEIAGRLHEGLLALRGKRERLNGVINGVGFSTTIRHRYSGTIANDLSRAKGAGTGAVEELVGDVEKLMPLVRQLRAEPLIESLRKRLRGFTSLYRDGNPVTIDEV